MVGAKRVDYRLLDTFVQASYNLQKRRILMITITMMSSLQSWSWPYSVMCVKYDIYDDCYVLVLPRYVINCGNVTLVYSDSQEGGDSDGHGDRGSYCSWRVWCWKLLWLQERPRQKDVCASQPVWKVSISKNTISKIGRIQECLAQFKLLALKESKLPHGIIFSVMTFWVWELAG